MPSSKHGRSSSKRPSYGALRKKTEKKTEKKKEKTCHQEREDTHGMQCDVINATAAIEVSHSG